MAYQTTIERPVETAGIGLHTAVPSRLRLVPAPADTGIVFRRVDLKPLISRVVPPAELQQAFDLLVSPQAREFKVLVKR